jgi:hypothetical protein
MRRLLHLAAALAVAAAFSATASGGVSPHRITDMFHGSTIDTSDVWAWWGTNQPGSVSFGQGDGVLTVDVAADAQPDFGAGGQTRCSVHGDFDAQVDFNLVNWPARNGVWVNMSAGGTPYNVYRVSWQFDPSESYGAYLPPVGANLPASDAAGTLRLTRLGDIFTAYYLSGKSWIPLISGTGPTGDVPLSVGVFNISNAATFAGLPVSVSFDNFKATADAVVCP